MISFVYIEPFVPIMSNPDITAKTSVVCNFYTYLLHSYGLCAKMPKYFAEEQLSRIRRPERRHNCNPDLWWWVAGGGPFSDKQSTIILHKNLFTWQPWLREYAGKFGWRGPDLIDWIFVASQEELICIQPVSPHLPTQANLIGEKGPETQKHHGHTCICNWSTCICICAKCIVFVITWFRLYLHSYYTSIVLVIVHGRTPWSLTYRPANHGSVLKSGN